MFNLKIYFIFIIYIQQIMAMYETTKDSMVYNWSLSDSSESKRQTPFLKMDLGNVLDSNNGNYSGGQINFNTVDISTNGTWAYYRNAFISIPLVCTLTSTEDMASPDAAKLIMTNNLNLINNISIHYNSTNVVEQNDNINPYLIFKQHTEQSFNDTLIHSHTGYKKFSRNWAYTDELGVVNDKIEFGNKEDFESFANADNLLVLSADNVKDKGENYFVKVSAKEHVYYYDCILRLRDLPFFEKMPMIRGAVIKITINLNQVNSLNFGISNADVFTVASKNMKGETNPVIVDSIVTSSNYVLTVKPIKSSTPTAEYAHAKSQCILHCPTYTMEPDYLEKYMFENGEKTVIKKITYDAVNVHVKKNNVNNFRFHVENSLSRMKRLVVIPFLSADANGTGQVSPLESPYASEPATTSPCLVTNMNVLLGGKPLYENSLNYGYENYLSEMNGALGLNAGQVVGESSSLISLKDYNANHQYFVFDLSRRFASDEKTTSSLEFKGHVSSPKAIDFYCYVVYEKDLYIDAVTSQVVDKPSDRVDDL
jgi:hypothetical protein